MSLLRAGVWLLLSTAPLSAPSPAPAPSSSCRCGQAKPVSKIVGGESTKPHEYPWQVGLLSSRSSSTPFCGGSLISSQEVLTAAHCGTNIGKPSKKDGKWKFPFNIQGDGISRLMKFSVYHRNDPILFPERHGMENFPFILSFQY